MLSLIILLFIGLATCEFDHEIHRKFKTLPKHEFVSYFNSLNHSWTIAEYSENTIRHLGAKVKANHNLPTMTHAAMDLPEQFDSREQWPHCKTIQQIYDQGQCGSDYVFSAVNSASDRTCIHANVHVHLSEKEGNCIRPWPCKGGYSSEVLKFWLENGLVTIDCVPYDAESMKKNICEKQCRNSSIKYKNDKHFGEKVYYVDSEIDTIRAELVKNGPVLAEFAMFSDLYDYDGGVYEHKYGDKKGYHSVRLIGFGVDEKGVDYWLLANSWGTGWGKNGFFRVKRNQTELEMEEFVYAGIPRKN